jgi:aminoglycoside 3-N-acetyltransferase I
MKTAPENFPVKQLTENDVSAFSDLIKLFHEVFETQAEQEASSSYLAKLLARNDFLVFVALDQNEVVGGLTGYVLEQYYGEYSEVYIYDIAVKNALHGKGIGKKLIEALRNYSLKKGFKVIFVEAHEEDIDAVEFYRRTGGEEEKVVHFNYVLK